MTRHRLRRSYSFSPLSWIQLEDRAVPALVTWTGNSGTNVWSNPANWDTGKTPQTGDDVVINSPAPVEFDQTAPAFVLNKVTCTGPFAITGSSLIINGQGLFGQFTTQSGGVLDGSGTVTFDGGLKSTGGGMQGTGRTQINFGTNWTIDTSINSVSLSNRIFDINGGALWTGTHDMLTGDGAFLVHSGGKFDVMASANWIRGTGTFATATPITIETSAQMNYGGSNVQFLGPLNNHGSIAVNTTGLTMLGGGLWSGTATGSGYLDLSGGTLSLAGKASIQTDLPLSLTGGGTLSVDSSATPSIKNLTQSGGTYTGSGLLTVGSSWSWGGGTITSANLRLASGTTNIINSETIGALALDNSKVTNFGAVDWFGAQPINAGGTTWTNATGSLVRLNNDSTWSKAGSANPTTFVNQPGARLQKAPTGLSGTSIIEASFTNDGIIQIDEGTLRLTGGLTNVTAASLDGGTYVLNGTLRIPNASFAQNNAQLTLNGSKGQIIDDTLLVNALTGLSSNAGLLAVLGDSSVNFIGGFTNQGNLTVGPGSMLTLGPTGDYVQTAGVTVVNGKLDPGGDFIMSSGILRGSGTISADLKHQGGKIAPGNSPGILTLDGDYEQSGELEIELNGTTPGLGYDQLQVNGAVILGGSLKALRGFGTKVGDTFIILSNDGVDPTTGQFTGIPENSIILVDGVRFRVNYNKGDGNDVQLTREASGIASVVIGDGATCSNIRELVVTFNSPVNLAGTPEDSFSLLRTPPGSPVTIAVDTSASTASQTIAKFTFSGANTDPQSGANRSLTDGKYVLNALAAMISDYGGEQLDGDGNGSAGGDYVANFHRFFGDIDCDGDVDTNDFSQFRVAFGTNSPVFDIEGDGDVDTNDFARFRINFGGSV